MKNLFNFFKIKSVISFNGCTKFVKWTLRCRNMDFPFVCVIKFVLPTCTSMSTLLTCRNKSLNTAFGGKLE